MSSASKSLYKDVFFLLVGVFVVFTVGYYIWLPDITDAAATDHMLPYLVRSVIMHIYVPAVVGCFLVSELSSNISQVDKIWSILPIVFCSYVTFLQWQWRQAQEEAGAHDANTKYLVMTGLVAVWGVRLTIAFYLKGGYSFPRFWRGEEDYRWEIVRQRLPWFSNRFLFTAFNLLFLCCYQIFVFLAATGMVLLACIAEDRSAGRSGEMQVSDWLIAAIVFILIIGEAIADRQQQVYQAGKREWKSSPRADAKLASSYEHGFLTTGLFAFSRHPNYSCEQAIWLTFYLFSVDAGTIYSRGVVGALQIGGVLNFSIAGCVLLVLLITKSTDLTEEISASKYSMYAAYQKHVSRIVDVGAVARWCILREVPSQEWMKQAH